MTSVEGIELKFNTQDFAPFSYEADGVVAGPAVDIIKKICSEMQIKCSFRLLPWRRAQQEMKNGKAHGMFLIGWNKKRSKWLYLSPPITKSQYSFFVPQNNPLYYKKTTDIVGYRVGVYGESNTSESLEELKNQMIESNLQPIKIIMKYDDIILFNMLNNENRNIDAVYSNTKVGYAIINQRHLKNIRHAGIHKKLNYYIGFSKQYTDKAIVNQFNATFKKLHKNGVIPTILNKYNMEAAKIE
ncbi:MAG: amino acid ABC transporter substrate-binding protein [Desulfobacteraceae bacterium]|nr:amino acid ABC transporter substrate-binding protein [Desulfobacteraceae bacterium]